MSLFGDGFTLAAAEQVLGLEALHAVDALTEQSMLSIRETTYGLRYRMLETVREFGRMRLKEAGEEAPARAAQRAWATAYALEHASRLFSPAQFAAADALHAEESNLAELLRQALGESDPVTTLQLLAGVGALWSIRGDHSRVFVHRDAITQLITGWVPPRQLVEVTRAAMIITLMNTMIVTDGRSDPLIDLLRTLPIGDTTNPRIAAMTTVMVACDAADGAELHRRLAELRRSADHDVVLAATQTSARVLENAGDVTGAIEAAERILTMLRGDEGPWFAAIQHAVLASLVMQLGDRRRAVGHARTAIPVLSRSAPQTTRPSSARCCWCPRSPTATSTLRRPNSPSSPGSTTARRCSAGWRSSRCARPSSPSPAARRPPRSRNTAWPSSGRTTCACPGYRARTPRRG